MNRLLLLCLLAACCASVPQDARSHGSVTPEDDLCIIRIGYYRAHFKIYLPQSRAHEQFCEDIPDTGETVFVMEYEHSGLGEVPIDFRIIRNTTGLGIFTSLQDVEAIEDIDTVTVIHHDAAVQPDVFTVRYYFEEQGEFVGIVKVRNPENGNLYTAVFPFEVGFAGFGWWPWFLLIAIALQLNYLWMSGWIDRWRQQRKKPRLVVIEGSGRE